MTDSDRITALAIHVKKFIYGEFKFNNGLNEIENFEKKIFIIMFLENNKNEWKKYETER